jgi:hypothetical protein
MAILDIQRASYPESRERPPRIARMSSKTQRAEKGIPNALAAAGLIAYGLSLLVLAAHRLKRSR